MLESSVEMTFEELFRNSAPGVLYFKAEPRTSLDRSEDRIVIDADCDLNEASIGVLHRITEEIHQNPSLCSSIDTKMPILVPYNVHNNNRSWEKMFNHEIPIWQRYFRLP